MSDINRQVDFSFIRYANCWEDADVLLQALSLEQGSDVCCVASAGDNALALLATDPASVQAFDISEVQLFLTELKQTAFAFLEYDEVLSLLGVMNTTTAKKVQLLQHLLPKMSRRGAAYWTAHRTMVEKGVIHCGRFEQYFKLFRTLFLPLVHSGASVQKLLKLKRDGEQKFFYDHTWNNRRWQWLLGFFFSRWFMGKYGRHPHFLKQVQIPVGDYIRQKAERHLQSAHCTRNYFLQMIFTGNYQHSAPFFLRKENFDPIKKNIHLLSLKHCNADNIVKSKTFDAYCLSNIFEYMSPQQFDTCVQEWKEHLPPGAILAYWNLMTPRSFAQNAPETYRERFVNPVILEEDKGFFYNRFLLEEKAG
jgi:S-adenosylmethionine-diacylglycerol 3-amino-3-carboxypropyl transferase